MVIDKIRMFVQAGILGLAVFFCLPMGEGLGFIWDTLFPASPVLMYRAAGATVF